MKASFVAVLLSVSAFGQQQPRLSNARVEAVQRNGALEAEVRRLVAGSEPLWIGYAVPRVPRTGQSCCYWEDGVSSIRGCALEPNMPRPNVSGQPGPILLEGPSHTTVLMRFEAGRMIRLRSYSLDCELDAGGLRVLWLTGVSAQESLSYLSALMKNETNDVKQSALRAISTHADAQATRILDEIANNTDATETMRRSAVSQLGALRGAAGFDALQRMLSRGGNDEPNLRMRERVVSALAMNSDARVTETLRNLASKDGSTRVRSEALLGLARKPGASGAIMESLRKDPDLAVRKRAVNALSRLPAEEGVPLLIAVAEDKSVETALRKEAVTWLGRTRDAKAIAYLEKILAK